MRMNNANGYYSPSFFSIVIETDDDISIALKKYSQTFLHEYIHYLQDLILPYNIRLNMTNMSIFSNLREYATQHDSIVIPFNEWNENSKVLLMQKEHTFGGCQFINDIQQIDSIQSNYDIVPSTKARVFKYDVHLNEGKEIYKIGARDLLEYIANKIESKHYPVNTYRLPYETVDVIFDHYGLSYVPYDIRVCIVEYCLYNDNPIHILFNSFLNNNFIRDNKDVFSNYGLCYNLLLNHSEWKAEGGFVETITSKTNRRLRDFVETLSQNYSAEQFSDIKKWLVKINQFVKNELSGKFIFSDMYSMEEPILIDFINYLIDKIGLPLVMNDQSECIALMPQGSEIHQFIHFHILQKFLESIFADITRCPIFDFCEANDGVCDENCITDPYSKISDDEMCPYIVFLKSYGLSTVKFINQ